MKNSQQKKEHLNSGTRQSIIFCRVSSKEQEETGYSLPAQEKYLKDYCGRNSIRIEKIFKISESASGEKQRSKFAEMMGFVEKQDIKIIVCEKADRLTRNFKDMVAIDQWLEHDEKREVHLVKDSLIMHRGSKSQEKLNWGIRILFAKNYIDNLSEEVKKGQKAKVEEGWLPVRPPLGYATIGEKGHKTHVIDTTEAPHIKKMFELYSTGNYSLKKLSDDLYNNGFRSKSGKKVGKSTLHRLLGDPFYYGRFRWKGKEYAGKHEPIITKDVYNKVQDIMVRPIKSPRYRKHLPLFKGKIKCGECGGTITWEQQKGSWYGHCNKYKPCSQKKYIKQEDVEEMLVPLIIKISPKTERVLDWLADSLKDTHEDQKEYSETKNTDLNIELEKINKRLSTIYDDKVDGVISIDFYNQKFEEYVEKKEKILEQINKLEDSTNDFYKKAVAIHELAYRARHLLLSPNTQVEVKRDILSDIFSNFELKDGKISEKYTPEFEFLEKWMPKLNETFELQENGSTKEKTGSCEPARSVLLGDRDSNPDKRLQRPLSYH